MANKKNLKAINLSQCLEDILTCIILTLFCCWGADASNLFRFISVLLIPIFKKKMIIDNKKKPLITLALYKLFSNEKGKLKILFLFGCFVEKMKKI